MGDARTTWMSAARDGAGPGVDELVLEAALRAGGRAAVAVCAEAAFASTEEFVHERSSYSRRDWTTAPGERSSCSALSPAHCLSPWATMYR